MGDFAPGKQTAVLDASSRSVSHADELTPGKQTLAQNWPSDQVHAAPIAVAQDLMMRGAPAEDIARVIQMQPQYASAIIMIAQQLRGNAYSQQILKVTQPQRAPEEDPAKAIENNVATRNKDADPILIGLAQQYVGSAHTEWAGAVSDAYTDISTESDSELKMFPAIVLNVFAGFLSLGVQSAITYIAEHGLATAAKEVGGAGAKIAEELSDSADSSLEVAVGSVIDQGKDMAKAPVNRITTNTPGEKGEKKEFLVALNRAMLQMFTTFGTKLPLHSSNKQLVQLCLAFNPSRWVRDNLQTQITSRVKEFSSSKTANIGRKNANAASRAGEKSEALEHTLRETGVAWLKTGDDKEKLVYVIQDFENADQDPMALDYGAAGVDAYKNAPMLSMGAEAHDGLGNKHKLTPTGKPAYAGDVEPNLVEIAIDKHKETWQEDPKTYDVGMILFGAQPNNTHPTKERHE